MFFVVASITILALNFFQPHPVFALSTTVSMTEDGFEPQEVTVDKGSTVTFVNGDKVDRWPASNIHPTHGIYPEFDPKGPMKPGESWSFTFDKAGTWKFHDHLLPHMRGTITVAAEKKEQGGILQQVLAWIKEHIIKRFSPSSFWLVQNPLDDSGVAPSDGGTPQNDGRVSDSKQFNELDTMIKQKGLEATWQYIVDTYKNSGGNGHDAAHFLGSRIYEQRGFEGLSICTPTFAFGCYHGFTDTALAASLEPLKNLAKACESIGNINSGPWASCIHGIGHGVGTFFGTTDLKGALSTCDTLTNGQTYCHDGVFMEFATSAPKTVYEKTMLDPLYPCTHIEEKYRQACARQQPVVLEKHFGMTFGEIAKVCIKSTDQTIRSFCIDALGLLAGQRSGGNPQLIANECSKIPNDASRAQCVSAAAGELVFQNTNGWQTAAPAACNMLQTQFKQSCLSRINQIATSYGRN